MNNLNTGIPVGQGALFGNEFGGMYPGSVVSEGGSMISGKWMNKNTGETVIVRDSVMDGESMILITNQGQLDMQVFSRDYIQVSDDLYDEQGQIVGTQEPTITEYYENKQTTTYDVLQEQTSTQKRVLNNFEVIDKIFTKIDSKPTIKFDIKWAKFPTNELQMLVNFLDVTEEDIAAYVVDKFVNQNEIAESMKAFVINQMSSNKEKTK